MNALFQVTKISNYYLNSKQFLKNSTRNIKNHYFRLDNE